MLSYQIRMKPTVQAIAQCGFDIFFHTLYPARTIRLLWQYRADVLCGDRMESSLEVGTVPSEETITKLCSHCQALDFNDKELGGFVGRSISGDTVLVFDEERQERVFRIPWECRDNLLDLAGLKASAQSGCEFCAFCAAQSSVPPSSGRRDKQW